MDVCLFGPERTFRLSSSSQQQQYEDDSLHPPPPPPPSTPCAATEDVVRTPQLKLSSDEELDELRKTPILDGEDDEDDDDVIGNDHDPKDAPSRRLARDFDMTESHDDATRNGVMTPPTSPPPKVPPRPTKPKLDLPETDDKDSNENETESGILLQDWPGTQQISGLGTSATTNHDASPSHNGSKMEEKRDFHVIEIQELRRLASQGIPDEGCHRALTWRILLGYLPPDTAQWEPVLQRDRTLYQNLVSELFDSDGQQHHGGLLIASEGRSLRDRRIRDSMSHSQHSKESDDTDGNPKDDEESGNTGVEEAQKLLEAQNLKTTMSREDSIPQGIRDQWKKSGNEAAAMASISGGQSGHLNSLLVVDDAGRQHSQTDATLQTNTNSKDSNWSQFFENARLLDEIRKDVMRTHPDLSFFLEETRSLGQRRYAALERILFIWAKLNKGVRYVQGMNEIVGTIYFVMANDSNDEWACEAEADSYFLFNSLMVEMRDVFVPDLDDADTGIQGRIANMMDLLALHDPEVKCHLDDCGIDATYYGIRWLTTLLSREFLVPDTTRIWDSMFASTHKDNFLRYVCVTMVMIIREQLLKGDFSVCLRLLQSYPPTDMDRLLQSSRALWIYESQVTLACHKGGISLQQALAAIAPPPTLVMAYGCQGGISPIRKERIVAMRREAQQGIAATKEAGKNFLGNAKGLLNDWRTSNMERKQAKSDYRRSKTT